VIGREGTTVSVEQAQAQGSTRARLAELYLRHSPAGLRLAYLLTGDRALAEDLMQEAFARLIARLRHLRDPNALDIYLRRTIVNLSTSHVRRRIVERAYLNREAPRAIRETREPDVVTHEAMRRALLSLPERQRAAIVLRFYEDLTEQETADALRCRPGTVRSLVSRGMAALRTDLREDDDE
jgi:RNA polymerase sigma-70 factor (sigma-E family)